MGLLTADVAPGDHIHTHNMTSAYLKAKARKQRHDVQRLRPAPMGARGSAMWWRWPIWWNARIMWRARGGPGG
jgi:hypothetical protein